jgi:hypothetical protein
MCDTFAHFTHLNAYLSNVQVYPAIYNWLTYPICVALERLWAHYQGHLTKGEKVPHHIVELSAVLERTLNFAHTGNPRVLTRTLMDELWVSKALLLSDLPAISPVVTFGASRRDSVDLNFHGPWPRLASTGAFALASRKSHSINYGLHHLQVRAIYCCVGFPNIDDRLKSPTSRRRRATYTALHTASLQCCWVPECRLSSQVADCSSTDGDILLRFMICPQHRSFFYLRFISPGTSS